MSDHRNRSRKREKVNPANVLAAAMFTVHRICAVTSIPPEDIFHENVHDGADVAKDRLRQLAYYLTRMASNGSYRQLAKVFNRTPPAILKGVRRIAANLSRKRGYEWQVLLDIMDADLPGVMWVGEAENI